LHPLIERGDAGAAQRAARLVAELSPEAGQALMADPANLDPANFAPALGKLLGIEPPVPPPSVQNLGGGVQAVMQGNKVVGSPQWPQRAPLQGPESFSYTTDDTGALLATGNRGTIRETGRRGAQKAGGASAVTVGPNGEMIVTPAKTNDVMRTASGFAARMDAAEKNLGEYTPSTKDYMAASRVMSGGPLMASLANSVVSKEGQLYYQAAADWVRSKLRKESGAVISPEEMAQEIKTYFPVPGDSPKTIAQKKQARAQAYEAMLTQAGGAVTPEAGAVKPPVVGENRKGYIYIGGDPAKRDNWVKSRE